MTKQPFSSRNELAAHQLQELRSLLAELFPGNKFYARKLNDLGITFDVASLDDFSSRFPFTSKHEIAEDQRAHPPFGTNLTYPLDRYTRFHQTSGTMGFPLRWVDTPESWDWMVETWMEIFGAAGVTAHDRVYFAFSFGPFIGFWLAFEAAARLGCLCLPGGGLTSTARLHTILDNNVEVLCCTPTYALRLAEVAQQQQIPLSQSKVRTLIVAGEPGGSIPAVRTRLSELWAGARIFDHHGMTEVGPVTFECPKQPGLLHVHEPAYLPEIIDPKNGQSVRPGEPGELVLTTLGRLGSPLLRYKTGDLVKASGSPKNSACACGRFDLALAGGILGRTDDMVVVRGVNIYPAAVEEIIRSVPAIAEYQVKITTSGSLPEMSVLIEPVADCPNFPEVVRKLENIFHAALTLRVPVTSVPIGTLPRFDMKAKRWLRS